MEIPLPGPIDESNSLINPGKIRNENCEIRVKSVDIHICIVTHAIPNPFGITVFTMIVFTVKKSVFVVNGFIFTHPYPTVCTVYILDIIFIHYDSVVPKLNYLLFMPRFVG